MALILRHQTPLQFLGRAWLQIREDYRAGNKIAYARKLWRIYNRIQAGDVTSNEVRQAFNAAYGKSLNTAQWNTLVQDKLLPIVNAYAAANSAGNL